MAKRLFMAGALLLLVTLGLLLWNSSGPSKTVYEGKSVTRWLEGHVASSSANPPYGSPGWKKADEALRHIGTNAIPTLLKMIRAKDPPPPVLRLLAWARRQRWSPIRYRYAATRNEEARYAFEKLGPSAAAAVPTLIRIYQADVSPDSKRCVASALGSIGHPAQAALPVLLRDFSHIDGQVRFDAVSAVMHIGGDPNVVLPAMQWKLKDPKAEIRWNAAVALSMYGGRARATVPALQALLPDPVQFGKDTLKEQVETALWRIAPETVGKPLIVEDPTPMAAGGTVTEALDVAFKGERHTLIPPGKAVPCVAQLWDSEPRGALTLYRRGPTTADDHCLGEFEVTEVPPAPESANISVLCVIADHRLILCARDNHNNHFLEIRRVR